MSETMPILPVPEADSKRTPTVYFIDDSATMREVIKIAFRRESLNVVTCADAASALAQFEMNPPDIVITDVIMPDQDGYSVCTQIRQDPEFGSVPVVLMSGVVNKTVADKAVSVGADELIRKPFQPQELISRVKALLAPKSETTQPAPRSTQPSSLTSLFAPPAAAALSPSSTQSSPPSPSTFMQPHATHGTPSPGFSFLANPQSVPSQTHAPEPTPPAAPPNFIDYAWPRALAEAFAPQSQNANANTQTPGTPAPSSSGQSAPAAQPATPRSPGQIDPQKLRGELARLELLVKKLQTELQIERQYNQALELQIQTLNHSD
jgi:CheY-like chemotaxis protein